MKRLLFAAELAMETLSLAELKFASALLQNAVKGGGIDTAT
jgi:hypothetical protein